MKTLILGFWGVGKSEYVKSHPGVIDLTDNKIGEFPSAEAVLKYWNDDNYDIVMADPWFEKALLKAGIPFYVVLPTEDRKEEFRTNFIRRYQETDGNYGGDEIFLDTVIGNWERLIKHFRNEVPNLDVIELQSGQWIGDAIDIIQKSDPPSQEKLEELSRLLKIYYNNKLYIKGILQNYEP